MSKNILDVLRLLGKVVFTFFIDKTNLKDLLISSNRELWYILSIILLVAMIASLGSQVAILERDSSATERYSSFNCYQQMEGYVGSLQIEIARLRGELEGPVLTCDGGPNPFDPKPVNPLYHPPAPPERRDHDVRRLLDGIQ